jgi:hypothetical protein
VDAHVFGVVLNMAPTKGPDAYRYGYGGYGGYTDKSKKGRKGKKSSTVLPPSDTFITPARRQRAPAAPDHEPTAFVDAETDPLRETFVATEPAWEQDAGTPERPLVNGSETSESQNPRWTSSVLRALREDQ